MTAWTYQFDLSLCSWVSLKQLVRVLKICQFYDQRLIVRTKLISRNINEDLRWLHRVLARLWNINEDLRWLHRVLARLWRVRKCEIKFVLPIILKSKKGLQRQLFAFSKLFFSASNLLLLFFFFLDSLTIGTANRIELRQDQYLSMRKLLKLASAKKPFGDSLNIQ